MRGSGLLERKIASTSSDGPRYRSGRPRGRTRGRGDRPYDCWTHSVGEPDSEPIIGAITVPGYIDTLSVNSSCSRSDEKRRRRRTKESRDRQHRRNLIESGLSGENLIEIGKRTQCSSFQPVFQSRAIGINSIDRCAIGLSSDDSLDRCLVNARRWKTNICRGN